MSSALTVTRPKDAIKDVVIVQQIFPVRIYEAKVVGNTECGAGAQ